VVPVGDIGMDVSKGTGCNEITEDIGKLVEGGGPVCGLVRRYSYIYHYLLKC
jgi:hypothetical protein